jgi:hypothetical protein
MQTNVPMAQWLRRSSINLLFWFVTTKHRKFTANNSPRTIHHKQLTARVIHRKGDSPQGNSPQGQFTARQFTARQFPANNSPQKKNKK